MRKNNIEIVSALYEAFARRDGPAVLQLVDPQITVSQTEQLPWGGNYHGVEGLQAFFEKLLRHVDSRVEISEYLEAGERLVAIGRTRGTVRVNNAPFDVRLAHVWTVQAGKATRFEPYIDTPKMQKALEAGQPNTDTHL